MSLPIGTKVKLARDMDEDMWGYFKDSVGEIIDAYYQQSFPYTVEFTDQYGNKESFRFHERELTAVKED